MKQVIRRVGVKETYRRENGSIGVRTINEKPSLAQQHMKDDVDVNNIVARYKATGRLSHVRQNAESGIYADLTELGSFQDMHHKIFKAREIFSSLPSDLRTRFGNDPQLLIDFMGDEKNLEESYKLGLRVKPSEPSPSDADRIVEAIKATSKAAKPPKGDG